MRAEVWAKVLDLWDAAVVASPEELRRLAGDDAELRWELESLLGRADTATPKADDERDPWIGRSLGPYRLEERLGAGGMGVVYGARRLHVGFEQRVAVKILHRALLGTDQEERFRAERQILADLDHPNIARLIDGGTLGGVPYVVMERVDGVGLADYCARPEIGLDERLRLFDKICRAVDYAHRHLVIHRDLKPHNILVTADGEPKLLDFGIAKILDPGASGEVTRPEARVLTPSYASPEQLLGAPMSTASDVFSLGIVLYEMVSGERPFAWDGRSPREIEATLAQAPEAPSVVADRNGHPWAPRLRGDLAKILDKALRPDAGERYGSAGLLAADLGRCLRGLPVTAQRRTHLYVLGKWVRRNRLAFVSLVALVLSLVALAVSSNMQARSLARQVQVAEQQRQNATQVVDFLEGVFELSDPAEGPVAGLRVRELLDRQAAKLEAELVDQPDHQSRLLATLGRVYGNLGLYRESADLLEKSLGTRRAVANPDLDPTDGLRERVDLALMLILLGDLDRARELLEGALRQQEDAEASPAAIALILDRLGMIHQQQARYRDAAAAFERSLALRRGLGERTAAVSDSLHSLADIARLEGRLDDAELYIRQALSISRELDGDPSVSIGERLYVLGTIFYQRGDYRQAGDAFHRSHAIFHGVLGSDHPATAGMLGNHASVLAKLGDLDAAEDRYLEALEVYRRAFGDAHARTATLMQNLGWVQVRAGRFVAGRTLLRQALDRRVAALGPRHPEVALTLCRLALVALQLGENDEAERLARRALTIQRQPEGDDLALASTLVALGRVLVADGRLDEAEPVLLEARRVATESQGDEHRTSANVRRALAELRLAAGDPTSAIQLLREAEPALVRSVGAGHREIGSLHRQLATALLHRAATDPSWLADASRAHARSAEILDSTLPDGHPERLHIAAVEAAIDHRRGVAGAEERLDAQIEALARSVGDGALSTIRARALRPE